ncbi:L,D-transpeptidase family protein [Brevibacterium sp. 50QC2O2]|uniref:L,D-transpeptidase family protein n=1 Tax=Brevibacterium sp. 50QC2O2 TaxID=2968459 RepID=UPI00211CD8DE|nr:L,D-transpeptidase family protein [Brevibacterium sp. 50QC2O2]
MSTKNRALAMGLALLVGLSTVPVSAFASPIRPAAAESAARPAAAGTLSSVPTTAEKSTQVKAGEEQSAAQKTTKQAKRPNLAYGSKGRHVKAAGLRLRSLGYFLPKVSSRYDQNMRQAVWALQKAAGIKRTGKLNQKTWKKLDQGVRPTAKSKKGRYIEVSLKRQLLYVVKDGKVVRTINASTGRSGWRTPKGKYKVYRQINGVRHARLGKLYRPKYFNGGIAVHGEWWSVPAQPASHGCVRVSNPAMDWIWKSGSTPKKTKVWVY